MKIKLTPKQQKDAVYDEHLEIDGIKYKFIEKIEEMEENGTYHDCYFQHPETGKCFKVLGYYCKYGYEDYGWEDSYNENYLEAIEVTKEKVMLEKWIEVKEEMKGK